MLRISRAWPLSARKWLDPATDQCEDRTELLAGRTAVEIECYEGSREELRPLFELAEDSATQLDGYLPLGRVLVARSGSSIIAHLQLTSADDIGQIEIKSLAVLDEYQGKGIGRAIVEAALRSCAAEGYATVLVATAAADIGNLRFYQRLGFRILRVERDAFTPATGYPDPITIDGIPLRDKLWFSTQLAG